MKKLLLTIASALLATSAFAYDGESFEYDGLYYTVLSEDDHTAEVGSNRRNYNLPEHVVVPSTVTYNGIEYSVTRIGDRAFLSYDIKSIEIPNTVTSIGTTAFMSSGITSIDIPESVTTIERQAFYASALTSVTIPKSVTSIGAAAFASYTLKEIIVAEGNPCFRSFGGTLYDFQLSTVLQYPGALTQILLYPNATAIGDYAFFDCAYLKDVSLPASIKTIGNYAFSTCYFIESVTIPDGVTSIGASAFQGCASLENVTIPASVTSIGEGAFASCYQLSGLNIDERNSHFKFKDGLLYDYQMSTIIECLYPIKRVTIPETVTTIGNRAFYGCEKLSSIHIPETVAEIGYGAFENCYGLKSVNIPSNIKHINNYTFFNCNDLRRITIPESVETIGGYAFAQCYELQTVVIPNSVTTIEGWATFAACSKLKTVVLPNSLSDITKSTFVGNDNLRRIFALNPTPPTMSYDTFREVPNDATVYCLRPTSTWGWYVQAFKEYTGITDVVRLGDFYAILDLYDLQIEAGATDKLNAYIGQLDTATVAAERWESSNPEIATVDDNGNVTAVKPGTAIVTYTMTDSNGATYSDTCTVTVGENSAVDEITADTFDSDAPADVYTLSGILVKSGATSADINALPTGLYILRQGPTAKKIAVK